MTLEGHSPDLIRLAEEGYDVEIRGENLLLHHVPYVNRAGKVDFCILVSDLSTNAERTIEPGRHEVWVVGSVPYDHQGNVIGIIADQDLLDFGGGLVACCRLSGKPGGQMPRDYHHKMSNYVDILGRYARAIDPSATYNNAPPREQAEQDSVFRYHDSASSRSALSAVTDKLRLAKVAIVGLGGTGSYILDLIAKTPIREIHLFDHDVLYAHNAFRAPGAASFDEVRAEPKKVDYYTTKYDAMRRSISPHAVRIDEDNVAELDGMDFVFLAMDAGPAKKTIIEHLQQQGISFVDCGMGVQRRDNSLRGQLRVTASTADRHDHVVRRVSYADVTANEYDWNIQTADLNMMNAAMAVLKWKKLVGYYIDNKGEFNSVYVIATNQMLSGETPQ